MGSNQVRMLRNCVPNQHALETELLVHICFVAGVYSRLLTKQPETQSSLSTCTYVRIVHDIDQDWIILIAVHYHLVTVFIVHMERFPLDRSDWTQNQFNIVDW